MMIFTGCFSVLLALLLKSQSSGLRLDLQHSFLKEGKVLMFSSRVII